MPISQGKITLTSTTQRLAGAIACRSFALSAPSTNEAAVKIAGTRSSTTGFPLEPGETVSIAEGGGLDDLWISGTTNDVLYWLAAA